MFSTAVTSWTGLPCATSHLPLSLLHILMVNSVYTPLSVYTVQHSISLHGSNEGSVTGVLVCSLEMREFQSIAVWNGRIVLWDTL